MARHLYSASKKFENMNLGVKYITPESNAPTSLPLYFRNLPLHTSNLSHKRICWSVTLIIHSRYQALLKVTVICHDAS